MMIISATQMQKMKHRAIVGNIGHFDNEIDMAGLKKMSMVRLLVRHGWHCARTLTAMETSVRYVKVQTISTAASGI